MDKPVSMSVKDYLIRTLAVKMMVSEKTIEAIVNHQFQSANEAIDTSNSLELAGFGKFFFNKKKAIKKIETLIAKREALEKVLAKQEITEQKKRSSEVTLEETKASIAMLQQKTMYE